MASFAVDEAACPEKTGFSSMQIKGPELVDSVPDLARDRAKRR